MRLMSAVTLNIDDFSKTVSCLKIQFFEKEGIEVQYQSLIYAGKPLRDGLVLIIIIINVQRRVLMITELKRGLHFTWSGVFLADNWDPKKDDFCL
jgi:Ubiquitin family